MLTSVAKILHRTHRKLCVNKEMERWTMRGILNHDLPMMMMTMTAVTNEYQHQKTLPFLHQKQCTRSPFRHQSHKRQRLSRVKKTTAVLQQAMTEKMKNEKAEIGTGPRKPGGSSPQGAAVGKAHGTMQSQKGSGKRSQQNLTRSEHQYKK